MIDLYLQTTNREDFLADLASLGLVHTVNGIDGNPVTVPIDEGVALDYIGPMVQVPPVLDTSTMPPTVTTPAVFYPGERANLRLTGPLAQERAALFAETTHAHGTAVVPSAQLPQAQRARWGDAGFPFEPANLPVLPPEAPAPSVTQRRAQLLARLATRRYEVEVGGITLDGVHIRTDRESSAMLSAAITYCNLESQAVVRWKTGSGHFVELGEAGLRAIALEVGRHVQRAFGREAELAEQLHAAPDRAALDALAPAVEQFWA